MTDPTATIDFMRDEFERRRATGAAQAHRSDMPSFEEYDRFTAYTNTCWRTQRDPHGLDVPGVALILGVQFNQGQRIGDHYWDAKASNGIHITYFYEVHFLWSPTGRLVDAARCSLHESIFSNLGEMTRLTATDL